MSETFERKDHRLDTEVYEEHHVYSLTLACSQEQNKFTNEEFIRESIEVLRDRAKKHDMKVHAYCFMPDHLHLLVEGKGLIEFVKEFKQMTGYRYKQASGEKLWQKSYYDHVLRKEEEIEDVARYIFKNPVRAGLVESFVDYPYSGSLEFDKEDI